MMKNIAETLRCKPEITRLTPHKQIQRHIKKLPPLFLLPDAARIVDPDARSTAKIRAPASVVLQKVAPESTDDAGVEGVDVVWRRSETHLSISKMKNKVLPLISDVVLLEAEEVAEPVEEVVLRQPLDKRRLAEVTDGA